MNPCIVIFVDSVQGAACCVNATIGRLLGSSAIIKRKIPSQLLEAAFTQFHVDESGDQLIPRSTDELVSYYKRR